jgi:apolipoprotein N-acyltransferase
MWRRARESFDRHRRRYLAATIGGVLVAVGFCGLDQWYLMWVAVAPALWALDEPSLSRKEAAAIGWLFGLVAHLGAYTWITGMLRDFGFLPLPLALLGYFLLCLGQTTQFAAWGFLTHVLVRRFRVSLAVASPVVLVLCEWLWPQLFPSYLSNSQYKQTLFIQSASLWGMLGLSFIVFLASSVVYELWGWLRKIRTKAPVLLSASFVLLLGVDLAYGFAKVRDIDDTVAEADKRVRVGIVQANMGIFEKERKRSEGLRRHREQTREVIEQGAELVVWPESGYNYPIRGGVSNLRAQVLGEGIDKPLIFGGLRVELEGDERRLYNSAYLLDGQGEVRGTYDKIYLLAFGEYLPLGEWLPFLYSLSPNTSHFTRGDHTTPLVYDGVKYGLLICYEDILPRFVNNRVMAHQPDVLVNITNDAWFGKTREPLIHLALATFRAVEQRRFLVRATNTGISAIVDPAGRILERSPVFARANLVGDVTPMSGLTLYARFGDWVGVLCLVSVLFWMREPVLVRMRRRAQNTEPTNAVSP